VRESDVIITDGIFVEKLFSSNQYTNMSSSNEVCIKGSLPKWQVLILGQMVALCYFGGSALTSALEHDSGFTAPNFTAFSIAAALSLFLIPVYILRRPGTTNKEDDVKIVYKSYLFNFIPLHGCWKAYALAGFVDYTAMLCSIIALQYTSLTSYTILRSLVTPAAMIFSKCCLPRKYGLPHIIGVSLCIVGVIINVIQDSHQDEDDNNTSNIPQYKMFGDLMAIAASTLYGLLDIICEYTLDEYDGGAYEYLGVAAFFTASFSLVPAIVWEWDQIMSLSLNAVIDLASLVLVDVGSYYFSSKFLEYSESALLNLSALTENLWAVLFSILLQKIIPAPLFFAGLAFSLSGLIIYESSPSPIVTLNDDREQIELSNMKYEMIVQSTSIDENADNTLSTIGSDESSSCDERDELDLECSVKQFEI